MTNCRVTQEDAEAAVRTLLQWIGENPERAGLRDTPRRVALAWKDMTAGYALSVDAILTEDDASNFDPCPPAMEPIVLKDIPVHALCEHHMLPMVGVAHLAYIPDQRIVGISKLVRLVDLYARRLQVQERLTQQLATTLHEALQAKGSAVIIDADHACIALRGIRRPGTTMRTSAYTGDFCQHAALRAQFMADIKG